jgi:hypothetical protein
MRRWGSCILVDEGKNDFSSRSGRRRRRAWDCGCTGLAKPALPPLPDRTRGAAGCLIID